MLKVGNSRMAMLLAVFLLASLPAWAEGAGLPQLDMKWFPGQLFWLVITFVTLYVLMSRVALPTVEKTQDNRHKVISTELEAARSANDNAKMMMTSVEKSMADARAKAQIHVTEMMADVNQQTAARHAEQEKDMLRKLHKAEADIAVTRQAALSSVHASATELSTVVVEKILGSKRSEA